MTLNAGGAECKVADPCRSCMHGNPHPPLLITYDENRGDYAYTRERVCTARWASDGSGHAAGSICGASDTRRAGDVYLCRHHLERAEKWIRWGRTVEERREETRAMREADKEYARAAAESAALREEIDARYSVVYFIRRTSDGMIRIGTTRSFENRMKAHRSGNGEIQILLTQAGGRAYEEAMHARFADYRIGRTEWFKPVRELVIWIAAQRRDPIYRKNQRPEAVPVRDLRRLVDAAPPASKLHWKAGVIQWPHPIVA